MTKTIQIGDLAVRVTLKNVRNVHLSVHPPDGRISLTAPTATRLDVARAYAISRIGWIREQQRKLRNQARESPRQFVTRESHYLWCYRKRKPGQNWQGMVDPNGREAEAVVREAVKEALRLVTREIARPFETHLPVYSLRAAAGKFGEGQEVEEEGWVEVSSMRLREGMFVAQVVGKSMEPRIPDGNHCIFRAPVQGSRQGKIVLVQHHSIHDSETGGRYTVKRYESEKVADGASGWRHTAIRLAPINPDFEAIVFREDTEAKLSVIAELVEVLRPT